TVPQPFLVVAWVSFAMQRVASPPTFSAPVGLLAAGFLMRPACTIAIPSFYRCLWQ
uniref:Uncharacterized protein n=1 Tax=Aegilops tauschii subsp. strangulata TaxID=200361 RepID=A0A453R516_AEGTS